jgi:hypothetical protein
MLHFHMHFTVVSYVRVMEIALSLSHDHGSTRFSNFHLPSRRPRTPRPEPFLDPLVPPRQAAQAQSKAHLKSRRLCFSELRKQRPDSAPPSRPRPTDFLLCKNPGIPGLPSLITGLEWQMTFWISN